MASESSQFDEMIRVYGKGDFFEDEVFTSPVRIQLTTTSFKQDTYFAQHGLLFLFVKGPYDSEEKALVNIRVQNLKKLMYADMPFNPQFVMRLKVDPTFLDTQYGARVVTKKVRDIPVHAYPPRTSTPKIGYFLVTKSLLQSPAIPTAASVPTLLREPTKMWPNPTRVVDFSGIENFGHYEYFPEYSKSMFSTSPDLARVMLMHVLLTWAVGSGKDWARRNFIIANGQLHMIDFEKIFDFQFCISETTMGKKPYTPELKQLLWDALSGISTLRAQHQSEDLVEVERRVRLLQTKQGILEAVTEDPVDPSLAESAKRVRLDPVTGRADPRFRQQKDFTGTPMDQRKSDVQKAIRRGMTDQALSSFFCGYNMVGMFPGVTGARAIQTNFINRLAVIAIEDVGMGDLPVVRAVLPVLFAMTTVTASKKSERCPFKLGSIVRILCEAKKSRIMSHMNRTFDPLNDTVRTAMNIPLADGPIDFTQPSSMRWKHTLIDDSAQLWTEILAPGKFPERHREFFNLLHCMYRQTALGSRGNYMAFTMCLRHFLVSASSQGDYVRQEMLQLLPGIPVDKTYGVYLEDSAREILPVMDISVDMHTAQGRAKKKNGIEFRNVGAVVERENTIMIVSEWKAIYEI